MIEKIADLYKEKKLTGLSDIRDESARGNVRIVIDLKKDAYPKKLSEPTVQTNTITDVLSLTI